MLRALPICALVVAVAQSAVAQQPAIKERIIELTVSPAPAPEPALKYQLLPELREMMPGNPVLGYLKCFSEQQNFFHSKDANDQRAKWLEMPLKDLPVNEMRDYGGVALRRADEAARMQHTDWQTLLELKRDGISTLLPEIQQMRSLVEPLHVRFRGEIADKRFDDALVTVKTMFALSRHLGEHPTILGNLVGMAIAGVTTGALEEMLQQPGCPNLFWALADLPSPLVSTRSGIQGQRLMWEVESSIIDDKAPMSEAQIEKAKAKLQELVPMTVGKGAIPPNVVEDWLNAKVKGAAYLRAARTRLMESGLSQEALKQFPPMQVVLLDEKQKFMAALDDMHKTMHLPFWQAHKLLMNQAAQAKAKDSIMVHFVSPWSGIKVREAQVRLEQTLAILRHVEALRMYASDNMGRLPKTLDDTKLPLPVDPVSGQAFQYRLDGKIATLRGAVPEGLENSPVWNRRYVIRVR